MKISTTALVFFLTFALLTVPMEADVRAKVIKVGILSAVNPRSAPWFEAFVKRLNELGYVEGQNLIIEFRNAEGKLDQLPDLAAELVRLRVDVIVAGAARAIQAAKQATSTIPIVMAAVGHDPIALGFVASLARPGGNVTGVSALQPELTAKRLELLKEAVPKVSRIAVLWDTPASDQLRTAEGAARTLGIELQPLELRNPPYDFESAFRIAASGRAGALLVLLSPILARERGRIAELAVKHRLPAISALPEFAEAGGLMTYAANVVEMHRHAAIYVDRILKGARPADLPVEQPTRFEFVINLKTAKALGLTLPQSLFIRADRVIE